MFKVASRFHDLDDIDLVFHDSERVVNALLGPALLTASTLLWNEVHKVVADITEAVRLDK